MSATPDKEDMSPNVAYELKTEVDKLLEAMQKSCDYKEMKKLLHDKSAEVKRIFGEGKDQTRREKTPKRKAKSNVSGDDDLEGLTFWDLLQMSILFFEIYSEMYPQHKATHLEHMYKIMQMIKAGKSVKQVLDYDDFVRKYYIELKGKPWASEDVDFLRMSDLLFNAR